MGIIRWTAKHIGLIVEGGFVASDIRDMVTDKPAPHQKTVAERTAGEAWLARERIKERTKYGWRACGHVRGSASRRFCEVCGSDARTPQGAFRNTEPTAEQIAAVKQQG